MSIPQDDALRRLFVTSERRQQAKGRIAVEARDVSASGTVVREGARVLPVIDLYQRRGLLTWRQSEAGRRLYALHALGIVGVRDAQTARGAGGPAGYADARLGAMQEYGRSLRVVPPRMQALVLAVCCEDLTVRDLALTSGGSPTALMALLRVALDTLADFYGLADDA